MQSRDHNNRWRPQVARALARLRRTSGAHLAFGGTVDGQSLRLEEFDGEIVGPLRDVLLDPGLGLGGRVVVQQRAIGVHDYFRSQAISHTYDAIIRAEQLRSFVAAPVVVSRRCVAVLYAATRSPQFELGTVFDAVTAEARALEQAIVVDDTLKSDDHALTTTHTWRQRVTFAAAELRNISADSSDLALQKRIQHTIDTLLPGGSSDSFTYVQLTPREQDVLMLAATGLSNNATADRLGIGLETVKSHMKSLLHKLDADNRMSAVNNARKLGLVP